MDTADKRPAQGSDGLNFKPELAVGPQVAVGLEQTQINKFHTKGGTGFAAEDANALGDAFSGRKVEYAGRDCSLNCPDRIVDGIRIQTKYYESATETMRSAFDSEGVYRYAGQRLEVPADQYEACVAKMRTKIADGKVPGVSNPADAESIIHKGRVTYRQARNIARAGTIDGLKYDAKTHAVGAGLACGVSFAINFAQLKWNGVDTQTVLGDGDRRVGREMSSTGRRASWLGFRRAWVSGLLPHGPSHLALERAFAMETAGAGDVGSGLLVACLPSPACAPTPRRIVRAFSRDVSDD